MTPPKIKPVIAWKRLKLKDQMQPRGYYYVWTLYRWGQSVEVSRREDGIYTVRMIGSQGFLIEEGEGSKYLPKAKAEGERMLGITPIEPKKRSAKR